MRGSAGGLEKLSAGVSGLVKKPLDCTVALILMFIKSVLTYACNDYINIIIAKDFLKNPENCERVVFFRKVGEQKILKLGYILQANINFILV